MSEMSGVNKPIHTNKNWLIPLHTIKSEVVAPNVVFLGCNRAVLVFYEPGVWFDSHSLCALLDNSHLSDCIFFF